MGRSTSCFKIITCSNDSADKDDLVGVPQDKRSSDKKVWSFRKRSERQRVLSNSVVEEVASGLKESPESPGFNFQQPDAPEKTSTLQYSEEKPQFLTPKVYIDKKTESLPPKEHVEENSQLSQPELLAPKVHVEEKAQLSQTELLAPEEHLGEKSQLPTPTECIEEKFQLPTTEDVKEPEPVSVTTNEAEDDANLDEYVVIIVQTAIRGFLAQKELEKLKNLVKLQAAVRGHLVRRHAVGSLRCVQAIVKMQLLVRARHARLSQGECIAENKLDDKQCKNNQKLVGLATKQDATYTSMEKLLSNRFACQLMNSTPKTKPIHIKCDSSKPNSAWSWLERWMSVSSSEKTLTTDLPVELAERDKTDNRDSPVESTTLSEAICESNEPNSDVKETLISSEREENLINYDATNLKFEARQPTSSVMDDLEHPHIDIMSRSAMEEMSHDQTVNSDAHSQTLISSSQKLETVSRQPKTSTKRIASEELETEGKKYGSRKASNPAFIAAQTKFELSSTLNSSKSLNSSHQDVGVDTNMDTVSSGADVTSRSKELSITGNQVLNTWRVQHGGSECGTELSVTSTLDSPERFEVANINHEDGTKASEQENCISNITKDLDVKENDTIAISVPDSTLSVTDQPEKLDDAKGETANSIIIDSLQVEQEPLKSTADVQRGQESETGKQAYSSSPEASPNSHMTVPESQGTPPSQISVKPKRKKTSSQKRKSFTAGKGSPLTPTHDSGVRSSVEQLTEDQKNGKRHNSFHLTRPENIDQEPRDSNSSNSIPHFMQATESARAKVNANNSPRSSPDVHDRDIFIKKRHSLPGANGRQGSPRIQQTTQAQAGIKGNEKRWQR